MEFWEDYELLEIETPENLELHLPLAGFGPRFLALLVDVIAISLAQLVIFLVIIAVAAGMQNLPTWLEISLAVFSIALLLLLPLIYYVYFELAWNGQSPGKRMVGIRVIRRGGFSVGWRESLWRNALRIADWLPANYIAGLVSFFATRNQQRLGDQVADTVVVREFTQQRPYAWSDATGGGVMPQAQGMLTPALSYVIGSYLQRSRQLSDEARAAISRRCIQALGYQAGQLSVEERENYLASVLQQSWQR